MSQSKLGSPSPTYFSGWIRTFRADGTSGVSTTYSGSTRADAMRDAMTQGLYYALVCGYGVEVGEMSQRCKTCDGVGLIRAPRARKTKRCPTCRGKDAEVVVQNAFALELPRDVAFHLADIVTLIGVMPAASAKLA